LTPHNELIRYRRLKAGETLQDAVILVEAGRLHSAVNRIYYALFYEVSALLLTKDLSSSRHSGIKALFNEHFVKLGVVSTHTGRFFSTMFEFRQKGDYSDFVTFEKDKVSEWLVMAGESIKEIEGIFK
jgi:hypothetical protein